MRSDYNPLYRSTVGFDRLFDMLENGVRSDWPPYNIEKTGENDYRITMAIAGYSPEEVELTQHGPELIVTGQKKPEEGDRQILHRGLAIGNCQLALAGLPPRTSARAMIMAVQAFDIDAGRRNRCSRLASTVGMAGMIVACVIMTRMIMVVSRVIVITFTMRVMIVTAAACIILVGSHRRRTGCRH